MAARRMREDNEDHGRNLMHKLMIEGRLEVRLLKNE